MKELLLGGLAGLLLGIGQVRMQLHLRRRLQSAAAGRDMPLLRALLLALGAGAALSALMMWLAVIDVDTVPVPGLHAGTLAGGALFGLALGAAGMTPGTSAALLGAGPGWEGLSAAAGCLAGLLCLPLAERLFPPVQGLMNLGAYTWFQVTLDKPFLFPGSFPGQGALGLALMALALGIRRPAPPVPEPPPPVPDVSPQPEEVQQDALVVTLPGEEPVVVDTAQDAPEPESEPHG